MDYDVREYVVEFNFVSRAAIVKKCRTLKIAAIPEV